jgi:hypothetical protein
VAPADGIVSARRISIRHVFVTRNILKIPQIQVAGEMVIPLVIAPQPNTPGAIGVDISCQTKIHIIVHGEIVTSLLEVKTPPFFLPVFRYKYPRGFGLGIGKESKWKAEG